MGELLWDLRHRGHQGCRVGDWEACGRGLAPESPLPVAPTYRQSQARTVASYDADTITVLSRLKATEFTRWVHEGRGRGGKSSTHRHQGKRAVFVARNATTNGSDPHTAPPPPPHTHPHPTHPHTHTHTHTQARHTHPHTHTGKPTCKCPKNLRITRHWATSQRNTPCIRGNTQPGRGPVHMRELTWWLHTHTHTHTRAHTHMHGLWHGGKVCTQASSRTLSSPQLTKRVSSWELRPTPHAGYGIPKSHGTQRRQGGRGAVGQRATPEDTATRPSHRLHTTASPRTSGKRHPRPSGIVPAWVTVNAALIACARVRARGLHIHDDVVHGVAVGPLECLDEQGAAPLHVLLPRLASVRVPQLHGPVGAARDTVLARVTEPGTVRGPIVGAHDPDLGIGQGKCHWFAALFRLPSAFCG
jgi:hypothetical protein